MITEGTVHDCLALSGPAAFLQRYEYSSLWETLEVQAQLQPMWVEADSNQQEMDEELTSNAPM